MKLDGRHKFLREGAIYTAVHTTFFRAIFTVNEVDIWKVDGRDDVR